MIGVVLDSNILISAIIFGGKPRKILRLISDQKIKAYISPYIIFELKEILHKKFLYSISELDRVEQMIKEDFIIVYPKEKVDMIKNNQADNKILECVVTANVDFLITGDTKHILPLGKIKNISIITASQFLEHYTNPNTNLRG